MKQTYIEISVNLIFWFAMCRADTSKKENWKIMRDNVKG